MKRNIQCTLGMIALLIGLSFSKPAQAGGCADAIGWLNYHLTMAQAYATQAQVNSPTSAGYLAVGRARQFIYASQKYYSSRLASSLIKSNAIAGAYLIYAGRQYNTGVSSQQLTNAYQSLVDANTNASNILTYCEVGLWK